MLPGPRPSNTAASTITHDYLSHRSPIPVQVIDLGLAKKVAGGGHTFTMCGTPVYMSPEIVKGTGYAKPADVWACGTRRDAPRTQPAPHALPRSRPPLTPPLLTHCRRLPARAALRQPAVLARARVWQPGPPARPDPPLRTHRQGRTQVRRRPRRAPPRPEEPRRPASGSRVTSSSLKRRSPPPLLLHLTGTPRRASPLPPRSSSRRSSTRRR